MAWPEGLNQMMKDLPVRFCGTGMYAPEEVLTNQYFVDYLDTSDEWIVARTGIRERRRVAPNDLTSTMAAEAARLALENAGLTAKDIGLIICATATGDCQFPATAAFIQNLLGIENIPAFDVNAACAGFLYGVSVTAGLLTTGGCEHALVIGAETLTRFTDPEDRATAVLLGDAAGAAILSRAESPEQAILYCDMGCDATRVQHIWVPAGGSRLPASQMTVAERLHYMKMKGQEVYKFAVTKMHALVDNALAVTGLAPEDLKLVIPHQSNLRIIESVRKRLGLPREKMAVNIDRFGNTSAASVIMSLDEGRRDGTLQPGDIVLMVAIGAGLTWGTAVIRL
jgi:3-oxoacyl-[acyl-carrier-protein] synthase-3